MTREVRKEKLHSTVSTFSKTEFSVHNRFAAGSTDSSSLNFLFYLIHIGIHRPGEIIQ